MEQHHSPGQVAAKLDLHPQTVRRHIRQGTLRSVKVGRARRIPESAVRDWIGKSSGTSLAFPDPEPISDGQRRALYAKSASRDARRSLGRGDSKKEALAQAGARFGRPIESSNDLTSAEASWTLDWLDVP
jgi:excisionase family DNA binding protein